MKQFAVILLALLLAGCASTGGGSGGSSSDDAVIEAAVRPEIARQYQRVGLDPARAEQMVIYGYRLEPTGRNADGYFGLLDMATVHGAYEGTQGGTHVKFWFAFPEGGAPDADTVSHECCHDLLIFNEGIGGHPARVVLNGKTWNVHNIMIAGARWPMRVWDATVRAATFWRDRGFSDMVNGTYYGPEETGFEEGE